MTASLCGTAIPLKFASYSSYSSYQAFRIADRIAAQAARKCFVTNARRYPPWTLVPLLPSETDLPRRLRVDVCLDEMHARLQHFDNIAKLHTLLSYAGLLCGRSPN